MAFVNQTRQIRCKSDSVSHHGNQRGNQDPRRVARVEMIHRGVHFVTSLEKWMQIFLFAVRGGEPSFAVSIQRTAKNELNSITSIPFYFQSPRKREKINTGAWVGFASAAELATDSDRSKGFDSRIKFNWECMFVSHRNAISMSPFFSSLKLSHYPLHFQSNAMYHPRISRP